MIGIIESQRAYGCTSKRFLFILIPIHICMHFHRGFENISLRSDPGDSHIFQRLFALLYWSFLSLRKNASFLSLTSHLEHASSIYRPGHVLVALSADTVKSGRLVSGGEAPPAALSL